MNVCPDCSKVSKTRCQGCGHTVRIFHGERCAGCVHGFSEASLPPKARVSMSAARSAEIVAAQRKEIVALRAEVGRINNEVASLWGAVHSFQSVLRTGNIPSGAPTIITPPPIEVDAERLDAAVESFLAVHGEDISQAHINRAKAQLRDLEAAATRRTRDMLAEIEKAHARLKENVNDILGQYALRIIDDSLKKAMAERARTKQ